DFGNAYLQNAHLDMEPIPGQLVIFPSWLAHQAMPYAGQDDRIIISFNASIHAEAGTDQLHAYGRG
ncbi:MAG: putative 2OG-Fe(II) oxygenase, partial [Burkholderiaceae bacterium]